MTMSSSKFVYNKFICTNCKACYLCETTRHFITRINEYLQKDQFLDHFKLCKLYKYMLDKAEETLVCRNVYCKLKYVVTFL